jgi:hypothetical protein
MNGRTEFRLLGIEPDNLLGFLAIVGVLQSLEVERPTWSSRIAWAGTPWRPKLSVRAEANDGALLETIDRGLRKLSTVHDYGGYKDLKFPRNVARDMQLEAAMCGDSMREQAISALFSDGAIKPEKDEIVAPPLCTMLGQGHQHFLARLESVSAGILPKALQKKRGAPNLNSVEYLERALFAPWTRNDETDAFRWDPAEDRRYALRDVDPSSDPARTEHGANRLAIAGLTALISMPTGRRGSASITTLGFSRGEDRRTRITWPMWTLRLDLPTILALLMRRELHEESPALGKLAHLGVVAAFRAYRLEVGYYANFSVAEAFVAG